MMHDNNTENNLNNTTSEQVEKTTFQLIQGSLINPNRMNQFIHKRHNIIVFQR